MQSTIDLAHHLGLQVVAEGAENREAWSELTRMGCDSGQGFYISRPMPPEAFGRWLAAQPQAEPAQADWVHGR